MTSKPAAISHTIIKPTLKRYIILLLFCLNSGNKAYQWLHVLALTTKTTQLYNTTNYMVNITSIIFMVVYLILSWPACLIIDKLGLRRAVLTASLGTTIGSTVKCFSCNAEGGIWLLIIGQTLVAMSEQLVFSLPSRLASVWFPDHQVSLAVALCVTGAQLGLAMGFIVPQYFLQGAETHQAIAQGYYHMFLGTAIVSGSILVLCVLLFDEAPPHAPGAARAQQMAIESAGRAARADSDASAAAELCHKLRELLAQIVALLRDKQLMLLGTSYGMVVGLSYTVQTFLDQLLKPIWPHDDLAVGNTGLLLCVAGVVAPPIWGRALDRWHAFKTINLLIALGSLGSLLLLGYTLAVLQSLAATYAATFAFGFFTTGCVVAGLEFAVELTYPAPELVTSSMMNLMPQAHSIVFILVGSPIVDAYGPLAASLFFIGLMLVAIIFLLATRETLRRQAAIAQMDEKPARRVLAHA